MSEQRGHAPEKQPVGVSISSDPVRVVRNSEKRGVTLQKAINAPKTESEEISPQEIE